MQEYINANSLAVEQSVTPVYTELRNVHHMPFQTTSGVDRHVHKYLATFDSFMSENDIYVGDMAIYGNNQEQKPNVYNSRGRHIHYQPPEYTVNENGVDNEICCTNTLPDIGSFFGSQKFHHTKMHTDNKAITTFASNIPLLPVRTTHVNVDEYLRKVQIPLLKQHFIDEPEAILSDIHRKEDIVRNSITPTISLNDKHIDVFSKGYSQSPNAEFGDHAMTTCIRQTEPDNHRYDVPAFYKPVLEVCRSRSVNVKDFHCPYCPKTFSQTANLTAHKRIHSGEKPFQCTICNKKFTQSSSVKTHMRVHTGERPYACNECGKTFADSSTLTKHKRIHSGVKPYQCRICSQKFSQSGNLNRHTKVHILKDKIVSCA